MNRECAGGHPLGGMAASDRFENQVFWRDRCRLDRD